MAAPRTLDYRTLLARDDDEFVDTEDQSSEGEHAMVLSRKWRAIRYGGFVLAALGACALVATFATLVSKSSEHPQQTDVESAVGLRIIPAVNHTCDRPKDFCHNKGETYQEVDCDGDGMPDPYCFGNGYCTCFSSANACAANGPNPCIGKPGSVMCSRPQNWCTSSKKGEFIFSMYDCDQDGVLDPFCRMADSDKGETSCSCLQSTNHCVDDFPEKCPDVAKIPLDTGLHVGPGQKITKTGEDGTFMRSYTKPGQMVKPGDRLYDYVSKDGKIKTKRSKYAGKVSASAPIHTGDEIKSMQAVSAIDTKVTAAPTPAPTPAPTMKKIPTKPPTTTPEPTTTPKKTTTIEKTTTTTTTPKKTTTTEETTTTTTTPKKTTTIEKTTTTPEPTTTTTPKPTTTTTEFPGLPLLEGPGIPVIATDFEGIAKLKSWDAKEGSFVKKGTKIATVKTKDDKTVPEKSPVTGVVTKLADIKPGDDVDLDGQLALVTPTGKTDKLPHVKGAKIVKVDDDGLLVDWKVDAGDTIKGGDTVATFKSGDEERDLKYDGPDGMVFDKQKLEVPVAVLKGTELISVGAGIFGGWSVYAEDKIKKGGEICVINVGKKAKSIKSEEEDGTVLKLDESLQAGDKLGFPDEGETLCKATLGHHLPPLPAPEIAERNVTDEIEDTDYWYVLVSWNKSVGDNVTKGDVYAVTQKYSSKGDEGQQMELKANVSGEVLARQDISPGDVIGPKDTLIVIGKRKAAAAFPWWIILVILLIIAIILLICCWPKKEEPPPPVKKEVDKNVYLYFDHQPFVWKYRPIGIRFHQNAPIRIAEFHFNSYGETHGLKEGMELTRIKHEHDDFNVGSNHDYPFVLTKLRDAIQPLPCWPLKLTFKKPNGAIVTQEYVRHPLGINFRKHPPIVVENVHDDSEAALQGVEKGWEILKIADYNVEKDHDFAHVNGMLHQGLDHLDSRK